MSEVAGMPTVGVVCHANILRSQVLAVYLRAYSRRYGCEYRVLDAGVCRRASREISRPDVELARVEERLRQRGLRVRLVQSTWNDEVCHELSSCALILAADDHVKKALNCRLPVPRPAVYGFYELIGEGDRDYRDTYDYERRAQRPNDFERSFDELQRIARVAAPVLARMVCDASE
jgi:protein-tyrosine-phosphatase